MRGAISVDNQRLTWLIDDDNDVNDAGPIEWTKHRNEPWTQDWPRTKEGLIGGILNELDASPLTSLGPKLHAEFEVAVQNVHVQRASTTKRVEIAFNSGFGPIRIVAETQLLMGDSSDTDATDIWAGSIVIRYVELDVNAALYEIGVRDRQAYLVARGEDVKFVTDDWGTGDWDNVLNEIRSVQFVDFLLRGESIVVSRFDAVMLAWPSVASSASSSVSSPPLTWFFNSSSTNAVPTLPCHSLRAARPDVSLEMSQCQVYHPGRKLS